MQQEFLNDVVGRFERLNLTYAIVGSIASSFWGVPRLTHDVDIVVVLSADQVQQILAAFPAPFYVSEQAAQHAVLSEGMFNIIDPASGLKADLWVSRDDLFSQSMLSRRLTVELTPGLKACIGSPEDVLLHKLVWQKINPSERQIGDAAGIAAVQEGKLDLAYMRDWAVRQSTSGLLDTILQGKGLKET